MNKWKVTPKEAIQIQKNLQEKISLVPLQKPLHTIGGADVSMNLYAQEGFAGFVTMSYPSLQVTDHAVVKETIPFPYIPGLLSFREIPMLLLAWEKLKEKPDVIVVDGVGIAHPRRMGIATHLGIILGVPTIGCSKNLLYGSYKEPENTAGAVSYIFDKINPKEIIGAAIRTKFNVKPVFVSPGHLITLLQSIEIIKQCVKKHRLPEPTRMAHNVVNEYRIKNN